MPFQLSPGVLVVEKDLTNIIPAVSTSVGAFAGVFNWGPVLDPTTVTSENELVAQFGRPQTANATSFFTAANFLAYSNNLLLVRANTSDARNASGSIPTLGALKTASVTSPGTGFTSIPVVSISGGTGDATGASATASLKVVSVTVSGGGANWAVGDQFTVNLGVGTEAIFEVTALSGNAAATARIVTAGSYSNISVGSLTGVETTRLAGSGVQLTVNLALGLNTVTVAGGQFTSAPTLSANGSHGGSGSAISVVLETGVKILNRDDYETNFASGSNNVGPWAAKYPGELGNSIRVEIADSATYTTWPNRLMFDGAPSDSKFVSQEGGSNDELHILVIDSLGKWTGTAGSVLEKFAFVSKASDAKLENGANNYYKYVVNTTSKYIWWMDHVDYGTNWGTPAKGTAFASLPSDWNDDPTFSGTTLVGGVNDLTATEGELETAFEIFRNSEVYDVSLIMAGAVPPTTAKFVVELAESRKDAVAFVSPVTDLGTMIQGATTDQVVEDTISFRTNTSFNVNSSYGVLDSGWKYQYDRYNDVYRWVPLNGDIAGLCARTDNTNDPWWSPGGLNRGQIRNVVKLSLTPNQAQRDLLYRDGINPVVSFPGQGTLLFGDKTLLNKPSAFDRINVRRLFIVLEKAIAKAAKYQLFEFNDTFTRSLFRSMVEPFLRDVQGRRGVIDFRVKCDETNNTGEVIDRNEFIADIYIKPARSINFITLNFIATRTGISFDEVGA